MTTLARVAVYVSSVPSAWRTTKVTLLPASPLSQPVMTSAVCPAALFPSTEMMVSPPTKPSFWAGAPSYTPTIERPVVTGHGADADAHHLLVGHAGLKGGVFFGRKVHGVGVAQSLDDLFDGLRVQGCLGDVVDVIFAQQVLQLVGGQRLGRPGPGTGPRRASRPGCASKVVSRTGFLLTMGSMGSENQRTQAARLSGGPVILSEQRLWSGFDFRSGCESGQPSFSDPCCCCPCWRG